LIKNILRNSGLVLFFLVFGCLVIIGGVLGVLYAVGFAVLIYDKIETILTVVVIIGSIAVIIRAITVVFTIIPRRGDTADKRKERIQPLQNTIWLAICIIFLVVYPIQSWLSIINAPVSEGDYIVDLEYRLWGEDEYGYEVIDESGIAPFVINIGYDVDYEDYTYYTGAVEQIGTRVSLDTNMYIKSVVLSDYGEYELYDDVYGSEGDAEVEIDGICCSLYYTIGDLTEERLGYTLEDKIANISNSQKVEFIALPLATLISIAGFFVAIRISFGKNNYISLTHR